LQKQAKLVKQLPGVALWENFEIKRVNRLALDKKITQNNLKITLRPS
jgi:hypothetical protein